MRIALEGAQAVALAAKLARVEVISAYPITPQTRIVETLSKYVANGELDAEFIEVESEHSALSACIGAAAMGARTFTSSASQGLALMHEVLFTASGLRLPIVMAMANRALSAPLNVSADHQDSMAQRDAGWIQIYVENIQEAFDSTLQAFKISEDERVLLPSMICMDGFYLSHAVEPVEVPTQEEVDNFLPRRGPKRILDPENPVTMGAWVSSDEYVLFKAQQEEAMRGALVVIKEVNDEFGKTFGRKYGNGLIESYKTRDADVILVTIGSMTGTARVVIDKARAMGQKVGLVKMRCVRPFPIESLRESLRDAKVVAVASRDISLGAFLGGALLTEIRGCLYGLKDRPFVIGFVCGLGGRDLLVEDFEGIVKKANKVLETGIVERDFEFLGV
jgi:pyruvate ferredoxin oxidoreductase alpha subunit